MLLFVDNFDSFTYNLVQSFQGLQQDVWVVQNDELSVDQILDMHPTHIVIGPGPGKPEDAGVCTELVRRVPTSLPLLGVCLGHQVIAEAFGGTVSRALSVMHGKSSAIQHGGTGLFKNVTPGFQAMRYHSLSVVQDSLPSNLTVTASTTDGEVMALQHCEQALFGVQFHPESVLTTEGERVLGNFLSTKCFYQRSATQGLVRCQT